MKKIINIVGNQYGQWLVLSYIGKEKHAHKWQCRCSCGKELSVRGDNLRNGLSTSCRNCADNLKRKEMIGKVFGNLKVIKYAYSKNGELYWECECQCSCDKIKIAKGLSLRKGDTKSCGCLYGKHCITHGLSKNSIKYRKYLMNNPFRRLRARMSISINKALKRNKSAKNGKSIWNFLPYTLQELQQHLEKLWEPWMSWNNYGGRPGDKRKTWWIDHIIPQENFQYKSMNESNFLECWSLDNLRPLEKIENIKKGTKCNVV